MNGCVLRGQLCACVTARAELAHAGETHPLPHGATRTYEAGSRAQHIGAKGHETQRSVQGFIVDHAAASLDGPGHRASADLLWQRCCWGGCRLLLLLAYRLAVDFYKAPPGSRVQQQAPSSRAQGRRRSRRPGGLLLWCCGPRSLLPHRCCCWSAVRHKGNAV